jgi:hypothetical protein
MTLNEAEREREIAMCSVLLKRFGNIKLSEAIKQYDTLTEEQQGDLEDEIDAMITSPPSP